MKEPHPNAIAVFMQRDEVEDEQSAEPLPARDRRVAVGRSHRLLGR
jgi:hypothetical protein